MKRQLADFLYYLSDKLKKVSKAPPAPSDVLAGMVISNMLKLEDKTRIDASGTWDADHRLTSKHYQFRVTYRERSNVIRSGELFVHGEYFYPADPEFRIVERLYRYRVLPLYRKKLLKDKYFSEQKRALKCLEKWCESEEEKEKRLQLEAVKNRGVYRSISRFELEYKD